MERRRMEGSSLKVEVMQKVPELVVHERMSQGKGSKREEERNVALVEDTEEMRKWSGISQSEMDLCWKNLAEKMEEEVLDKCKLEESKREAFRGRGAPLEWTRVCKNKKFCWTIIFSLFRENNLQHLQSTQESTEEDEMMQQERMVIVKDLIKKIRSKEEWTLKAY